MQVGVDREGVHEQAQEPVEGEEGGVDTVSVWVGRVGRVRIARRVGRVRRVGIVG